MRTCHPTSFEPFFEGGAPEQGSRKRKHAKQALERSLSLLQATLESTADGLLVVDREGKVTIFNSKFLALWRIPESLAESRDDSLLLQYVLDQLQNPGAFMDKVKNLYSQPDAESFDVLEFKDGRVFERYSKPQRIGEEIIGRVWSFRDVTEQRQTEKALQKSEKDYRLLAENATDAIWTMDMGLNFTYISPSIKRLIGYTVEEAMSQRIDEILTPASLDVARKVFADELALERMDQRDLSRSRIIELEQNCRDGSTVWTESTLTFIRDPGGRAVGILGVTRDISERRRAEAARKKNEEMFRDLFDGAPVGYHEYDTKGLITNVNRTDLEMLGYSREEMIGQYMWEFNVEKEMARGQILEKLAGLRPPGRSLERTYRRKDGTTLPVLIEDRLMKDERGRITGIRSTIQDITQLKQMEKALREKESRYRNVIENIQDIFYQTDKEGILTMASPSAAHLLGYDSLDEIIGKSISTFWKYPQKQADLIRRVREEGPVIDYEVTAKKKDGSPLLVSTSCAFYRDETGKVLGIEGIIRDITERKRAEQALRESEERYRALAEGTAEAVLLMSGDGRIVYANPAAVTLLHAPKTEDLLGHDFLDFVHPDDRGESAIAIKRSVTQGLPVPRREHRLMAVDGRVVQVESTGMPLVYQGQQHILGVFHDITEKKRAEKEKNLLQEQLQQAQKMEAIGTLAGGIAHDFNNILTAILGYAELASLDLPGDCKAKENLQQSIRAGHRAKALVQQILAFSRQGREERKPLNIKPIIKEELKFLRASLPATIEIQQDMGEDLATIVADPTQVHQVLMNLCTNAAHAMGENGGGLRVSLNNCRVEEGTSASVAGVEPGPYLRLRVSDTGHGMPPEILKRIFEPYFTTKEVGKGTGLGLAVVHGIVKSYGGGITVSSEVGRGSTFDVYFPRVEIPKEAVAARAQDSLPSGGHERILLVDDEHAVAEIVQGMLNILGYRTSARTSSIEALELFRAKPDHFDLVITDMTMPNMTGDKLTGKLLEIRPDIPVILCTGYSEYITKEKGESIGIRELLLKPLAMKELAQAVRRVLDSNQTMIKERVEIARIP
jgi:PAS domain S-box-containing protein